jgi:hypothetical protein
MLINTLASALPPTTALPTTAVLSSEAVPVGAVPSDALPAAAAKAAAARPLAGYGPGAVGCAGDWIGGGYPAGPAGAASKVTGGYAPGFVDAVHPPKARFSATNGSNVQSTVQHNTMTRLIPVLPGGVGPHPEREPKPA